ncbi:zinc finger protein 135-like [Uranotaenia lowii]|uniref:zinc finger protein 135-like n=1 Tax=Uranotaenia lowii TaxID=190385 RepID=UPI0024795128|nr:zinc finger protein 135-like [Uranotaenia lowii]
MVSEIESSDTDYQGNQASEAEEVNQGFQLCPEDKVTAQTKIESASLSTAVLAKQKSEGVPSGFTCEHCGTSFRKRDHFDRHNYTHTGVKEYRCTELGCGKEYTNRTHLNRHIRTNHAKKPIPDADRFTCEHPTCRKSFATYQSMKRHYDIKHVLGKSWSCAECGEKFWRKLQLKQHVVRHTGQYPHRCNICDKGFINAISLRNHRYTHALHKCADCLKEFVRWTDLVAHRRLHHVSFHHCSDCERKFPSKRLLHEHQRMHQRKRDEELEVFQCTYENCPKFYEHERNLLAHIKAKHEGAPKYVCTEPKCGKALASSQKLEQHQKLHESAARSVARMKAPSTSKAPARRKDAGKPKRSTACRLAKIQLDPSAEKILIEKSPEHRPSIELDVSSSALDSASESEAESKVKLGAIVSNQLEAIRKRIRLLQKQQTAPVVAVTAETQDVV